ncbi:CBS domain-containing protein [Desulfuribacillus alkaliarsenatis]|nr:CBS domain-containing protein [Desulfuribacillus alkaliarsenatis]
MMNMHLYTIFPHETIYDALRTIDDNRKGFVIVIDVDFTVLGILTDGDLRRSFLEGKQVHDPVKFIYNSEYEYVREDSEFDEIIKKFKSSRVNFLPIVNSDKSLVNIITKKQFHILLMEDISFDLQYDFMSLDEEMIEHEIYDKPWGFFKTTFLNPYSRAKIIKINPLGELSLQEHSRREEHWVIIKGTGELIIGDSKKVMQAGDYIFIPKQCKHKITNISSTEPLMISEIQLGEYFGEDDIIRYDDKYGRVSNNSVTV